MTGLFRVRRSHDNEVVDKEQHDASKSIRTYHTTIINHRLSHDRGFRTSDFGWIGHHQLPRVTCLQLFWRALRRPTVSQQAKHKAQPTRSTSMDTTLAAVGLSRTMSLFSNLCRANLGLLNQKVQLLEAMRTTLGATQAKDLFSTICPVVHASVGQHMRHSMDHVDRAVRAAESPLEGEIHYDLRQRGGADEVDMDQAQKRIEGVMDRLQSLNPPSSSSVEACFMLSGDGEEFRLPSTVERELGFATHHGIHHMAMIKIIALQTLKLPPEALPADFGKAPSTINFESSTT